MNFHHDTPQDQAQRQPLRSFLWVSEIHTLGPIGTNCERAALVWATRSCPQASVHLHDTMEAAADWVTSRQGAVLLSVVAYPNLHLIIYSHIEELQLIDVFIMNTDEMVLASATGDTPVLCSAHPATDKLIPIGIERKFVSSNATAAAECANGSTDGCLTIICMAQKYGLKVIQNFGPVPMGFTIHGPVEKPRSCARDADRFVQAAHG